MKPSTVPAGRREMVSQRGCRGKKQAVIPPGCGFTWRPRAPPSRLVPPPARATASTHKLDVITRPAGSNPNPTWPNLIFPSPAPHSGFSLRLDIGSAVLPAARAPTTHGASGTTSSFCSSSPSHRQILLTLSLVSTQSALLPKATVVSCQGCCMVSSLTPRASPQRRSRVLLHNPGRSTLLRTQK